MKNIARWKCVGHDGTTKLMKLFERQTRVSRLERFFVGKFLIIAA